MPAQISLLHLSQPTPDSPAGAPAGVVRSKLNDCGPAACSTAPVVRVMFAVSSNTYKEDRVCISTTSVVKGGASCESCSVLTSTSIPCLLRLLLTTREPVLQAKRRWLQARGWGQSCFQATKATREAKYTYMGWCERQQAASSCASAVCNSFAVCNSSVLAIHALPTVTKQPTHLKLQLMTA